LEFDGTKLMANTRKGSKLEITPDLLPLLAADKLELDSPQSIFTTRGRNTWQDYFTSKLMGFFQARMYYGE